MIVGKLMPWEQFRKQLDPTEEETWKHIVYMAKETGEPQAVYYLGIKIGAVWPSGACQTLVPGQEVCPECGTPQL